jgi:serine/threonine protein kinase
MDAFPYFPDYTIESVLGEGGMATVYMAIQQKLQRRVAIKVLDPALLRAKNIADRFLQEAQMAANLNHPNIISIFDVGQVGKLYYIVMEYLEGSLKDLIKSSPRGKLPPEESLDIIKKIAPALDYAHRQGIIHRDIKPDNIMFRQDGTPVLVDFGIARAVHSDLQMTKPGMGIGTPYYMSPEQCQTEKLDGRSDFYSLGVVLYEILTGNKPYEGDTLLAVALKQIQEPIPTLPENLAQYQPLLDKVMAKKKQDRVQNGAELQRLIAETLQPPQTPKPAEPPQPVQEEPPVLELQEEDQIQEDRLPQIEPMPDVDTAVDINLTIDKHEAKQMVEEQWTAAEPLVKEEKPKDKFLSRPQRIFSIPNKIVVPAVVVVMLAIFVYFFYRGITSKKQGESVESPGQQTIQTTTDTTAGKTKSLQTDEAQAQDAASSDPEASEKPEHKPSGVSKKSIPRKTRTVKEPISTPQPEISDEEAYENASGQNTVDAFRKYLEIYPSGRHVDEAIAKMDRLKEGLTLDELRKRKFKRTHHLRTGYKTLSYDEVETMIKRHGFFEGSYNNSGTFKNNFEKKVFGSHTVLIDHKTALMWHPGGSNKASEYRRINRWLRNVNKNQYAGFSDWRLPTLEEAASLLRSRKNNKGLYTDPAFSGTQKRIWTGDRFGAGSHWVVRFYTGIVYGYSGKSVHHIRPVRSNK